MPVEPHWLPAPEVIEINRDEVAETGEPFHVLSMDALEGALAPPQQHWHYGRETDTLNLAVLLMAAIASAHAFEQGNKRTGFTAGVVFLNLNGYGLAVQDDEVIGRAFEAVVERRMTWEQLAGLFRRFIIPVYGGAVVPIRSDAS